MQLKKLLWFFLITSMLIFTACGKEETSNSPKEDSKSKVEKTNADKEEKESKKDSKKTDDGMELNPYIAEESEGKVEIIFTNTAPNYTHDMDGFKISVDEYQIVKVTDINDSAKIRFKDQGEGYIVTSKVTINNGTDKPLNYGNYHRIQLSNSFDFVQSDWINFIAEDKRINTIKKNQDDFTLFEAGEKVTGFITFSLTNDQYDQLKTVKPKYIIKGGLKDSTNPEASNLPDSPAFNFIFSKEQAADTSKQFQFYQDRLTTDNWADKKMIFEKSNISKTEQFGDVKVTLEGVQYAEVIPTEVNKGMFSDFGENGVAALTVKLTIDNQSSSSVSVSNLGTVLEVDGGRLTYLSQGTAEPRYPLEIEAGNSGEKLHVFLFKLDEFKQYKNFTLVFGPFKEKDGNDAFNGQRASFTLPR